MRTFEAEGSLRIDTQEVQETLRLKVFVKLPDSLRIKIEGPAGIDGASLFLDDKNYLFYNHREEILDEGQIDSLQLGKLLKDNAGIEVEESVIALDNGKEEVLGFFLGRVGFDVNEFTAVNFHETEKKENIFKSNRKPDMIVKFPLRNSDLDSIEINDDNGEKRITKEFRTYLTYNNVRFPKIIVYTFHKENSRLRIRYTSFRWNKNIADKEFNIDISEEVRLKRNKK